MSQKIFLSFLGVTPYEPVCYTFDPESPLPPAEKYIQLTLLDTLASSFASNDAAYIFLTEEAKSANWDDDGHINRQTNEPILNVGLNNSIKQRQYHFPIYEKRIESESKEQSIWSIFQTVFDCITERSEIYLDITHSWRYLPMLGMTLLNYAKALKKIEVKA